MPGLVGITQEFITVKDESKESLMAFKTQNN
jgi:hypothetical protein